MERIKKIKKITPKTQKSISNDSETTSKKKLYLDSKLVSKAFNYIKILDKERNKDSNNILALNNNPFVYLTILVNELPKNIHFKPLDINLKHSIHGQDFNTRSFFITTNKFKVENKDLLREFKSAWKFVSYEKFSKNFHQYKDRLSILKEYDLFFCDSKIYSILKKHCGTHFYRQKKYPFPVDFSLMICQETEKINNNILSLILTELLLKKSFFVQGNGPEYALKIGRLNSFNDSQILENTKFALKNILKVLIERGIELSNLRRVNLKGEQTDSFPLFSHLTPLEKMSLKRIVDLKNQKIEN